MPDIIVQRGAGVSQGGDVIAPLLSTDAACLARGRIELDTASGLIPVTLEVVYRDGVLLGQVVEIFDSLDGSVRYGKITSIQHAIEGPVITTTLRVLVPSGFVI